MLLMPMGKNTRSEVAGGFRLVPMDAIHMNDDLILLICSGGHHTYINAASTYILLPNWICITKQLLNEQKRQLFA